MSKINATYSLFLAAVVSLTMLHSCSDDISAPDGDRYTIQLASYGISRAESITGTDETISAFLVNESNAAMTTGTFQHVAGESRWTSNIFAHSIFNYYIYGFMPAACAAEVSVTSADYAQGATMTVRGLKSIMTDDACVVVGAKVCTDKDQDIANSGIVPGQYRLTPTKKETELIYLLFDHLYSCLDLQLSVDAEYDQLRTIKVKKVTLQCTNPSTADATITLPYGSKEMTISWTTPSSEAMTIDNLLATDEVTLTTETHSITRYILPQLSFAFTLITEYDVYDKKGNLVRQNCKATNKLSKPKLEFGKKYPIKLMVKPTYLYQLSEPDLDNPTIVLG